MGGAVDRTAHPFGEGTTPRDSHPNTKAEGTGALGISLGRLTATHLACLLWTWALGALHFMPKVDAIFARVTLCRSIPVVFVHSVCFTLLLLRRHFLSPEIVLAAHPFRIGQKKG